MTTGQTWRLARFGRFVPCFKEKGGRQWKVIEADDGKSEIVLTIVESGQLLVSQGHDFLDGISLLGASDFLKVHQKSDNLIFRYTVKDGITTPNQPPSEITAPLMQTGQGEPVEVEPEIVRGSLSIKRLSQHFLGMSLPQVHHHCSLPQGNLEPFLRVCLLDPSFPAFVEEVEGELKKLLQD
ncbi:meiotic recombination protein REC114 isoform X3 [Myripristis murdjan]|uniref:meiotic recombination protein REC114 isoform X3 n=1 Tax=Myripristis murdjan TaxID=586833 RepID=UPI001175F469|nr:meiotic recombination protein REC114 isoform X3 [Myripristis murdjan]